jgi:hypothetical protein
MKIPDESNWVAHTPPPFCANAAPYEFEFVSTTVQPVVVAQFVLESLPVCFAPDVFVHVPFTLVWSAIWLAVCSFTPSKMSISPFAGHSVPAVQNEGQTEHP